MALLRFDVTGFGFLGHMIEMIRPSEVDVEINSVPFQLWTAR